MRRQIQILKPGDKFKLEYDSTNIWTVLGWDGYRVKANCTAGISLGFHRQVQVYPIKGVCLRKLKREKKNNPFLS